MVMLFAPYESITKKISSEATFKFLFTEMLEEFLHHEMKTNQRNMYAKQSKK